MFLLNVVTSSFCGVSRFLRGRAERSLLILIRLNIPSSPRLKQQLPRRPSSYLIRTGPVGTTQAGVQKRVSDLSHHGSIPRNRENLDLTRRSRDKVLDHSAHDVKAAGCISSTGETAQDVIMENVKRIRDISILTPNT